mgnify:CR=1 FL=1
MRDVALLTGEGEGCDYTIGCNRNFTVFEAADTPEALRKCKAIWEDHGGANGDPRVEGMELYAVAESVAVPVNLWNEVEEEESEREQAEEELRLIEARSRQLRSAG